MLTAHITNPYFSDPLTGALNQAQLTQLRASGVTVKHIGESEEGRPLHGLLVGDPQLPLVSIVAGAHPDEPLGPLAALRLVSNWAAQSWSSGVRLAVVPVLDPDGVAAQQAWLQPWHEPLDITRCFQHRLRRQPGADREFAWPGAPWPGQVAIECQAADSFFAAQGPAMAHLTLHGMLIASGAWFLLNRPALGDGRLWQDLRALAAATGVGLHDMPRNGEKGFRRCGPGFCTVPSGYHMRRYLCRQADGVGTGSARAFGLGSMDVAALRARRHGYPEPLCAVSEFPLFVCPAIHGASLSQMRETLTQILHSDHPQTALTPLPLLTVADAMVAMVGMVAQAARRRDLSPGVSAQTHRP